MMSGKWELKIYAGKQGQGGKRVHLHCLHCASLDNQATYDIGEFNGEVLSSCSVPKWFKAFIVYCKYSQKH